LQANAHCIPDLEFVLHGDIQHGLSTLQTEFYLPSPKMEKTGVK
jgi:hypothetical protein